MYLLAGTFFALAQTSWKKGACSFAQKVDVRIVAAVIRDQKSRPHYSAGRELVLTIAPEQFSVHKCQGFTCDMIFRIEDGSPQSVSEPKAQSASAVVIAQSDFDGTDHEALPHSRTEITGRQSEANCKLGWIEDEISAAITFDMHEFHSSGDCLVAEFKTIGFAFSLAAQMRRI